MKTTNEEQYGQIKSPSISTNYLSDFFAQQGEDPNSENDFGRCRSISPLKSIGHYSRCLISRIDHHYVTVLRLCFLVVVFGRWTGIRLEVVERKEVTQDHVREEQKEYHMEVLEETNRRKD